MTINRKHFALFASWACIFVCLSDFVITYTLGKQYPEYRLMADPISNLGASVSPIALYISAWWIMIGIIFILFGISFKNLFADKGKPTLITCWIIIIYGIGEGIGSGIFPYNFIGNKITLMGIFHEIFGGVAIFIILVLPLVLRKIFTRQNNLFLFRFLLILFYAGILMMTLLSISRFPGSGNNFFTGSFGVWQFLLTLVIYCNLIAMAIMMLRKLRSLK
jgi:hypothetical protein